MAIKREIKIGIIVIVAIAMFVYGINLLKGYNLFNKQMKIYAVYPKVEGLIEANPLLVNGVKVGQVNKIELLPAADGKYNILVTFLMNSDVKIPKKSIAKIISSDLLGSKAVAVEFSREGSLVQNGDTLVAGSEDDLKTAVNKQIQPLQKKAENLISSIDSVMQVVTQVMNANVRQNLIASFESIKNTIISLELTTNKLGTLVNEEQYALANIINKINSITGNIEKNNEKITRVISNFENISDSISKANIKQTIEETNRALSQANQIFYQINKGDGTMGKLLKNDSLYNNLNKSAEDLDKLMKDLRINPERYVHISVFGRKDRKKPKN